MRIDKCPTRDKVDGDTASRFAVTTEHGSEERTFSKHLSHVDQVHSSESCLDLKFIPLLNFLAIKVRVRPELKVLISRLL